MDFYLEQQNVVNRLVKEWKEHGELIIAYDFDNTVFDYHGEGHSYRKVTELLRTCKEMGAYLIVFTAASSARYNFIEKYLSEQNIPYDTINENKPGLPFPQAGSKVYYNILLDDRAGLESAYHTLRNALLEMQVHKEKQREEEK